MDDKLRQRFDERAVPASSRPRSSSRISTGDRAGTAERISERLELADPSSLEFALSLDQSAHDDVELRASRGLRSSMDRSFLASSRSFLNPREASGGDDGKASLTSSTINLVNSVLGTGLLALPRAFAHSGFAWGFALSTLAVVLNVLTSVFVSEACRHTGAPASFTKNAEAALKGYSIVVNTGLVFLCLAATCSYVIVATDSFRQVANPDGPSWWWCLLTLLIVSPLSFLRSMDSLRFTSLAAVLIVLFLTALIVAYSAGVQDGSVLDPCPPHGASADCPAEHGRKPHVEAAGSTWGILSAFSSLSLAYGAQMSVPPIFNEMQEPTPRRSAPGCGSNL